MTDNMSFMCLVLVMTVLTMSCSDDVNSTYSTKYPVRFYYEVVASTELYNAIDNPGQFVTIRPINGKLHIKGPIGEGNDYPLSQIGSREFEYGLGGLIIGTSNNLNANGGYDHLAYDLACPSCDRQSHRLTLKDGGTALCKHCGNSYDLNNYGWIVGADTDEERAVRGLYRYRIMYNGVGVSVSN